MMQILKLLISLSDGEKPWSRVIKKARRYLKQVFEKPKTITFRSYSRHFLFLEPGHKSLKEFFWFSKELFYH